ncbi:hypothetical protein LPJ61_006789, partial [Coemansia biformis]
DEACRPADALRQAQVRDPADGALGVLPRQEGRPHAPAGGGGGAASDRDDRAHGEWEGVHRVEAPGREAGGASTAARRVPRGHAGIPGAGGMPGAAARARALLVGAHGGHPGEAGGLHRGADDGRRPAANHPRGTAPGVDGWRDAHAPRAHAGRPGDVEPEVQPGRRGDPGLGRRSRVRADGEERDLAHRPSVLHGRWGVGAVPRAGPGLLGLQAAHPAATAGRGDPGLATTPQAARDSHQAGVRRAAPLAGGPSPALPGSAAEADLRVEAARRASSGRRKGGGVHRWVADARDAGAGGDHGLCGGVPLRARHRTGERGGHLGRHQGRAIFVDDGGADGHPGSGSAVATGPGSGHPERLPGGHRA